MHCLTFTLMYFGSGASISYNSLLCGVEYGTLKNILSVFRPAIAALGQQFIRRPMTKQSALRAQAEFLYRFGLPRCIGVVDGTFIPVMNPGGDFNGLRFMDRHGNYSMNCFMCVNYNGIFTFQDCRYPGSCDDSTIIFQKSDLSDDGPEGRTFGGAYFGDDAFSNTPFVATIFKKFELSTGQEKAFREAFNKKFCHLRRIVKSTFEAWKGN